MILLGFLTFFDPPREDAAQVLEALRRDGVEVKILTGDNALVTRHICAQVGLNTDQMVLGDDLDRIFLYDLSQVTIPTDNVDATFIQKPQRWNIKLIRDFMIIIGPISSIFDFLTFFVMLAIFHAAEPLFHTGWFVESLATQTLVLFVIRTSGHCPACTSSSLRERR